MLIPEPVFPLGGGGVNIIDHGTGREGNQVGMGTVDKREPRIERSMDKREPK